MPERAVGREVTSPELERLEREHREVLQQYEKALKRGYYVPFLKRAEDDLMQKIRDERERIRET